MPAPEIAKAARLRNRLNRTGYDSLEARARLHLQGIHQSLGGFPDRNHQHPAVGVEIVKVFTDAQHTSLTVNVPLESSIDAGFREGMLEKLPGGNAHVDGEALSVGAVTGKHAEDYTSRTTSLTQVSIASRNRATGPQRNDLRLLSALTSAAGVKIQPSLAVVHADRT